MPSALITNVILGPLITVSWTVDGIMQHLSGTINGTSVTPKTFNITNIPPLQTPQQQFHNVQNGERYGITVKAYSNGFTSAEFTANIRTTSTRKLFNVFHIYRDVPFTKYSLHNAKKMRL